MKQQMKRYISLLLALLLCVGLLALPASADEVATSGACGENLAWKLEAGTLTITGKGAMADYSENTPAPWYGIRERIQQVKVEQGVTHIGNMAFYQCANLTMATLPDSTKTLGELAFAECTAMTRVAMPGVEVIGRACFYACKALANVILPERLHTIGEMAFYFCKSLAAITIPASVKEMETSVFCYCSSLVRVQIDANLETLPYWSFYGCDLLWQLYLPATITEVGENALVECDSLYHVNYSGSEAVKEEIQKQLDQQSATSGDQSTHVHVDYEETDGAVITTTSKVETDDSEFGEENTEVVVDATITDPSGWGSLIEEIEDVQKEEGITPTVEVVVMDHVEVDEGALDALADLEAVVTVHTSDNVDWKVVMRDQTGESLSGGQNFSISISPNSSDKYSDTIGDAKSYIVQMGKTSLNSTVLLPLGRGAARQNATLYVIDGGKLRKLASVIVDDDGKAAFALAGTVDCKYLVALNVRNVSQDEVIIPEKLAPAYGIEYTYGATLTDSQGNQYVLTGRVNKLGFGIGTLTLIVVGVLVGSMILVGIVMMLWNKQQKQKHAQYRRKK